jgi:hypothetical protein
VLFKSRTPVENIVFGSFFDFSLCDGFCFIEDHVVLRYLYLFFVSRMISVHLMIFVNHFTSNKKMNPLIERHENNNEDISQRHSKRAMRRSNRVEPIFNEIIVDHETTLTRNSQDSIISNEDIHTRTVPVLPVVNWRQNVSVCFNLYFIYLILIKMLAHKII